MNNFNNAFSERPWIKNYDPHIPENFKYPKLTLDRLFEETAREYADTPFLFFKKYSFSYASILEFSDNLAKNLINLGLKKGERVALILPNIPQFVIAYFAILKAGGIVVAMNPNYKLNEFQTLFHDSQPKVVFCLENLKELIIKLESVKEIKSIITTSAGDIQFLQRKRNKNISHNSTKYFTFFELLNSGSSKKEIIYPGMTPEDPAIFQFSGGTTGIPKAAIGLHKNLIANVTQFQAWCDLKPGKETILAVIPLYHVYGMVLALNLGASTGARIILVDDPRNIDLILGEIENHAVTFYPGVPTMFYAINQFVKESKRKCDLSSIKACISGSAPLHPRIKEEFEKLTGGKLVEGYGLSEAPTATHCNPLNGENKVGSIGLPLPEVDCRVVDIETGFIDMPVGSIGELILKGPQVMQGYFNNPKENKNVLRDGWLYTGDVVKMDEDGYFYIIDRKKSLIKVGGFQVWPNEIEVVLNSHPKIKESAVGGVQDLEKGEKVIAWIVKNEGQEINVKEVLNWCRQQLVYYKIPSEIIFVDSIPHTGVGKVLRRELIRDYQKKGPTN